LILIGALGYWNELDAGMVKLEFGYFILSKSFYFEALMYIDPNTGGMLFQVLAAALAIFSGAALVFSSKIKAFFARLRRNRNERESGSDKTDQQQD